MLRKNTRDNIYGIARNIIFIISSVKRVTNEKVLNLV